MRECTDTVTYACGCRHVVTRLEGEMYDHDVRERWYYCAPHAQAIQELETALAQLRENITQQPCTRTYE